MPGSRESRAGLERQVLQALCRAAAQGSNSAWQQRLTGYRWQEPIHRLVFEILCDLPRISPAALREQLPTRLTRRGFPDADWEIFFAPSAPAAEKIEELIEKLLGFRD